MGDTTLCISAQISIPGLQGSDTGDGQGMSTCSFGAEISVGRCRASLRISSSVGSLRGMMREERAVLVELELEAWGDEVPGARLGSCKSLCPRSHLKKQFCSDGDGTFPLCGQHSERSWPELRVSLKTLLLNERFPMTVWISTTDRKAEWRKTLLEKIAYRKRSDAHARTNLVGGRDWTRRRR